MSANPEISGYRIGDITLDSDRRCAHQNGAEVRLSRLTYQMLLALAQASPRSLSKQELAELVWEHRFTAPSTVKQRVNLLRDALSDDAANPKYIRVKRGHGYSLIPAVEPIYRQERLRISWSRRAAVTCATIAAAAFLAVLTPFIQKSQTPSLAEVDNSGIDALESPTQIEWLEWTHSVENAAPDAISLDYVSLYNYELILQGTSLSMEDVADWARTIETEGLGQTDVVSVREDRGMLAFHIKVTQS